MDNILDPIVSSDTRNQEDMSYLFGRDPSILAYGQRPCVSKDTKKNLLSVYEIEEYDNTEETGSINSGSQNIQTVKVYLRMKPFPKKLKVTQEQQDAYRVIDASTLFTRLPTLENNTSCLKRSNSTDIVCRKFTFTQTFGPQTTQLELFDQAVKQQMIDFLGGQNSTIMTYGTTNSGKSYTLQGTTTSPGIVPRCLEFVFSTITPKSTPSYKPVNHCDVVALDPLDRAQELEMKTKLLTFASIDKYQYINAYKEMQKLLLVESPNRPSQYIDAQYSVWVSFAEIYNEIVYDLLSNECQKKRSPLKLATDSHGRAFIKGLKTVCVSSGSEAYQVLMAGQYNLKVAATALNARSSRSHCIFTIKLLKYYVENDPSSVEVSTFVFCDLAGSERLKKTLNIGDRLKEAQNINTSLLVLGRCLKTIHEGQMTKRKIEHVGPFRESKLTRLFQKALSGKEHIVLIVNINPIPNLYIETQNVLNFAAIAKKIVIEKEKIQKRKKSRFSQIVTQSIKTVTDWDATELESEEWQSTVDENAESDYIDDDNYEDLINENEKLKKDIATLKNSVLTRDLQVRQEMADTYTAMMKELETEWKNRIKDVEEQQEDALQWSVKQVEDFYKQKLSQLNSRKRRRSSLSVDNLDDSRNIDELELENSRLTSKIVLLKSSVKELKESNQTLTVEKNKTGFELSLAKEDLKNVKSLLDAAQQDLCTDEDAKRYIDELKEQLFSKQEQVKKLKVFLNEAKEEYIAITTEVREKEYIIKEQEEDIYEKQEVIEDLEAGLAHIRICLADKTKAVDNLEEKLENETKNMMNVENKMQGMQEQINLLANEKLALLDEVQLLKNVPVAANRTNTNLYHKSDARENSIDSSKIDEASIVNVEQSLHLEVEVIIDDLNENDRKEKDIGREKLNSQVEEKMLSIEAENSALKQKIVRSTTEIQSLKDELESAKLKLKDIAEQIRNLKVQRVVEKNEDEHKVAIDTTETGCQVCIESDEQSEDTSKNDIFDKSSQTVDSETREMTNQTSFSEQSNDYETTLDELAKITIKYDDVKTQYNEKCQMVEKVEKEVLFLRDRIGKLSEESNIEMKEYKQSVDLLQKELSSIKEDNKNIEEQLKHSNDIKVSLEEKISAYERRLNEAEEEVSRTKSEYNQCTEKFNRLRTDFDTHISKCKAEHEEVINTLQKKLSTEQETKSQCLGDQAAKILELEHNLEGLTELKQKIEELNQTLETCKADKEHLQELLNDNNYKLQVLQEQTESAEEKEREKDDEIISLQKEMKHMIQQIESEDRSDKLMEFEMKNTIKDLTATKEILSRKEEYIAQLEIRAQNSEQNAKILDLLQQSAQEGQAENQRLRAVNEELKHSLIEKEREMETFMKNRDDMVMKYESLVKTQQEELEKRKRAGATKHHSKDRDYCENTSEDEVMLKERRIRRAPKKFTPTSPKQDEISVIELSGSETKRSAKRTILPPPEPVSETRKTTRRKKLYMKGNESFQDVEPLESTISVTPSTSTRSLRTRRK